MTAAKKQDTKPKTRQVASETRSQASKGTPQRKKNWQILLYVQAFAKILPLFSCSLSKATWAVQNASSKPAGFSRLPGLMCSILGQVSTFDFFFFVKEETDAASCSFLRFKNSHSRRTLKVNCAWNSIHFEENGQGRRSLLRLAWISCGGGLNPCNLC